MDIFIVIISIRLPRTHCICEWSSSFVRLELERKEERKMCGCIYGAGRGKSTNRKGMCVGQLIQSNLCVVRAYLHET